MKNISRKNKKSNNNMKNTSSKKFSKKNKKPKRVVKKYSIKNKKTMKNGKNNIMIGGVPEEEEYKKSEEYANKQNQMQARIDAAVCDKKKEKKEKTQNKCIFDISKLELNMYDSPQDVLNKYNHFSKITELKFNNNHGSSQLLNDTLGLFLHDENNVSTINASNIICTGKDKTYCKDGLDEKITFIIGLYLINPGFLNIIVLDISHNNIGLYDITQFIEALKVNNTLKNLNISHNMINNYPAYQIIYALQDSDVTHINISNNLLTNGNFEMGNVDIALLEKDEDDPDRKNYDFIMVLAMFILPAYTKLKKINLEGNLLTKNTMVKLTNLVNNRIFIDKKEFLPEVSNNENRKNNNTVPKKSVEEIEANANLEISRLERPYLHGSDLRHAFAMIPEKGLKGPSPADFLNNNNNNPTTTTNSYNVESPVNSNI